MFATVKDKYDHMRLTHPVDNESPFGCPIGGDCVTRFNDKKSIMTHVRQVHNIDPNGVRETVKKMRPTLRKDVMHSVRTSQHYWLASTMVRSMCVV